MSQNAMAEKIGADKATISRFMNGVLGLSQQKLDALAELLGLEIVVRPSAGADKNRHKPRFLDHFNGRERSPGRPPRRVKTPRFPAIGRKEAGFQRPTPAP